MARLVLKLTNKCNFDCSYCYLKMDGNRERLIDSSEYISFDTCRRALDFMMRNFPDEPIRVSYYGGEPLLAWKTLRDIIDYGNSFDEKKRIFHSMTTNGSLLGKHEIDYLEQNSVHVNLSIDDVNDRPDIFETIGMFNKTLLTVRVNISNEDSDPLYFYRKLKALDVLNVIITPVTSKEFDNNLFIEKYKPMLKVIEDEILLEQTLRESNVKYIMRTLYTNTVRKTLCSIGDRHIAVNTDGIVFPCSGFLDLRHFEMGRVDLDSDTYVLDAIRDFYGKITVDNKTACKECWMKHICAGNCSHANYLLTKDVCDIDRNDCLYMKLIGELALAVYSNIMKVDENLIVAVLQQRHYDKLTISKNVLYSDRGFIFKTNENEHLLFELDSIQKSMFEMMDGNKTVDEIYSSLKERYKENKIPEDEYIETIRTYVDNGILVYA